MKIEMIPTAIIKSLDKDCNLKELVEKYKDRFEDIYYDEILDEINCELEPIYYYCEVKDLPVADICHEIESHTRQLLEYPENIDIYGNFWFDFIDDEYLVTCFTHNYELKAKVRSI